MGCLCSSSSLCSKQQEKERVRVVDCLLVSLGSDFHFIYSLPVGVGVGGGCLSTKTMIGLPATRALVGRQGLSHTCLFFFLSFFLSLFVCSLWSLSLILGHFITTGFRLCFFLAVFLPSSLPPSLPPSPSPSLSFSPSSFLPSFLPWTEGPWGSAHMHSRQA